ncbi:alpha-amylase family glycosyl hydrolase [Candidatus Cyanaurora vandensis]|uniref:alpha-amylase family glycosyl hydrolase n=1 Tax=Candidatus Cyanaurora vandensis TaxID=2714958 RepID=UPI00257EE85A|nr:alpha-amylase family glycosyl hydrolase [Candidatus Cyanaurora vandensis]
MLNTEIESEQPSEPKEKTTSRLPETAKISFNLLAPYNEKVSLVGEFSNWEPIAMQRDETGTYQVQVSLPDGEYEYKFQAVSKSFFAVDQEVTFADPYARQVTDKDVSIMRIKDGKPIVDSYEWQHDDAALVQDDQLMIYELHVYGFNGGGYRKAVERLDYLVDLGMNCVQLMPVTEYPGANYWGYNPRYPFAPESSYGKPEDLKYFIDECHKRGLRVILDLVLNHSERESPLTRIDFTYWFYEPGTEPDEARDVWGPKFNLEFYDAKYQRNPAREYLYALVEYWVEEYHLDGYRIDAARQIKYFDFLAEATQRAKKLVPFKPFYVVAEHVPENPAVTGIDGPVDGAYHETYYWMIDDLLVQDKYDLDQLINAINPVHYGYSGPANAVNFYENHDKPRLLQRLQEAGVDDENAFRRLECAAALLITSVGIPMLYQGQEIAHAYAQDEEVHLVDWSLLEQERHQAFFERWRGLVTLRRERHALWTANCDFFHMDPEARVIAYVRFNDEGSRVVVVAHVGDNYLGGYTVPCFPEDGVWHEWTRNYDATVDGALLEVELGAWDVHIFCLN